MRYKYFKNEKRGLYHVIVHRQGDVVSVAGLFRNPFMPSLCGLWYHERECCNYGPKLKKLRECKSCKKIRLLEETHAKGR